MGKYFALTKETEEDVNYLFPEEMKIILKYLKNHGEVKVTGKEIEDLWMDFSDERYSAFWMGITGSNGKQFLAEFAEWLDKKE